MIVAGWSVKGGSGCTVVCTALGCELSGVMVDLSGDVSALLGRSAVEQPGLVQWLHADPSVEASALDRLTDDGSPALLAAGEEPDSHPDPALVARLNDGLRWLDQRYGLVLVDIGSRTDWLAETICATADMSLLVLRPCTLSIRAVARSDRSVVGSILVGEGSRSLDPREIEGLLGVPMLTHVRSAPAIAQCVDAGRLASATPRELRRSLRPVVDLIRASQ